MQFEYRLVPVRGAESTAELNAAGAAGFDAVGMSPLIDGNVVVLLKRPVPAPRAVVAAGAPTADAFDAAPAHDDAQSTGTAALPMQTRLSHPQWETWLADAAGDDSRRGAAAAFWELYGNPASPPTAEQIHELGVTACRITGTAVPAFAG